MTNKSRNKKVTDVGKCRKCKRISQLVSVTDDGLGKKYCRRCKREIKDNNPELKFRRVKAK